MEVKKLNATCIKSSKEVLKLAIREKEWHNTLQVTKVCRGNMLGFATSS